MEHDDVFVLPGEPGYEDDDAWEDLEENENGEFEGRDTRSEAGEVCVTPNDKQNDVTPREHRKKLRKTFGASDDESDDDDEEEDNDSDNESLGAFNDKYYG